MLNLNHAIEAAAIQHDALFIDENRTRCCHCDSQTYLDTLTPGTTDHYCPGCGTTILADETYYSSY